MNTISGNVTTLGVVAAIVHEIMNTQSNLLVIILSAIIGCLLVLAINFSVDGIETNIRRRWRNFRYKMKGNDLGFNKRPG